MHLHWDTMGPKDPICVSGAKGVGNFVVYVGAKLVAMVFMVPVWQVNRSTRAMIAKTYNSNR